MQMTRSCTSIACQKKFMHSPVLLVHVPKSYVHGWSQINYNWTAKRPSVCGCAQNNVRKLCQLRLFISAVQQFNQPVVHVISVCSSIVTLSWSQTAHVECMLIMLLSAEATARRATITTTGCSTHSFAFVRVMPPGLLQLANGRTAIMRYTAFAVSPECCCTSFRRRV